MGITRSRMSKYPIQPLNRNNINKRASVGLVILNGGVSPTLVSRARSNPKALYPNIGGKDGVNHSLVEEMDLVYTEIASKTAIHMHTRQDTGLNGAHHKAFGISRLNGQGISGQDNEQFMNSIKVLGFCDRSNTSNGKGLFPIAVGGIKTGMNTGNWTLHVGDRVMFHALSEEELKINRGKSGKTAADGGGDLQLCLKPYHPDKNMLTVRPIFRCLRRKTNGEQGQTKSYIDACDQLMDSVRKLAIPVVFAILGEMTLTNAIDKRALARQMLTAVNDEKNWPAIENAVFAAHAPVVKGVSHFIDPVVTSELHKAQAEALDKFLLYAAKHFHGTVDRCVGTILSEAKPQENVDILIGKYSL